MGKVIVCRTCEELKQHYAKGQCKLCYKHTWREENLEHVQAYEREYQRRWARNNREKVNTWKRRWRKKNPDKRRIYGQHYYKNNLERIKEYWRRHYKKHSEKKKKYARQYYQKNREKMTAHNLQWQKDNRERCKVIRARRRAREKLVPRTLKSEEGGHLLKTFPCFYCNGNNGSVLDHFVPLSKGGGTTRANVVVACMKCNGQKGTKLPEEIFSQLRFSLMGASG